LQLALRIDQEIRGRYDLFAFFQSFRDDEMIPGASPQLHFPRFEVAVAPADEDDFTSAGLQDAACRNDQLLS